MKRFSVRLTDGTSKDVRADFAQLKNGDLIFSRQTAKRPELIQAFAAGAWTQVEERA